MVLIVKPASSAILTDHVFNTTNQNTMISLRKLPQIFLKQELHETLHAKMWSAPSMQVTMYANRIKKVYATSRGDRYNRDKFRISQPTAWINTVDDTSDGEENALKPEGYDDKDRCSEEEESASGHRISHNLHKADGTLEPVPEDILGDSEDSIEVLEDSMAGWDDNDDDRSGCHGLISPPGGRSIREETEGIDGHNHNTSIGKLDASVMDQSEKPNSERESIGPSDTSSHKDMDSDLWPGERGVEAGAKGEAVVADVSVLPSVKSGEMTEDKIRDHLMFGWSERQCDKGSISEASDLGSQKLTSNMVDEEERVSEMEELARWERAVFDKDAGKTPDDYHRRADIFGMSGEAFVAEKKRDEAAARSQVRIDRAVET